MENLKKLVFSTPLLRTLDFLLHQKDEVSDIEITKQILGVKRAAVHQALTRLSHMGIIDRIRRGRRCYNILHQSNPWFLPLKITSNLLEIQPLVEELKAHVTRLVLFGSRAQGTNDAGSDFDLFVIATDKPAIVRIIDNSDLADRIQLIVKTEAEMLDLEESEPVFARQIRGGVVLWEK